jgi:hypothetical protein
MNSKIIKVKLRYKKNAWNVEAPNIKETRKDYYQALNLSTHIAKAQRGELHIFRPDGELKEVVKFY